MKKWKCLVCGYIHDGDEPPEKCPVCGADKSKFVELPPEEKKIKAPEPKTSSTASDKALDLMVKHHVHPISVHIPNGVVPISVIFVILAVMFNFLGLAQAAFYNLIFVLLAMPMALFSGYNEWQRKYEGNKTGLFTTKIICGFVVTLTAVMIVVWHMIDPEVTTSTSSNRGLFLLLNLIMLAATGIAGHLGGKLVFKD
ncbi:MAG: hypothetical protein JRF40_06095 [Deltaproteobacteria bacterium]|nr:hypothetical protein [Deltaproteobacteria bacterium]MBW2219044.1 hypothetical protein [Deltaproteobacteria bacterium]